ncbi:MAG TPA: AMP-binding protein, partial [Thermodesulfobacteriota bacterium]|nr:AMP-binding protein [Thermodesulfobacteriota bacterium]
MVTDTLIQLFISRAKRHPDRIALRERQYGIWIPTTWAELWQKSASFGLFLKERGLEAGECVILWGDNKPEWLIAEMGTLAAGGVISGIYPDSLPEEAKYLIEATDAKFIVVGDQEQADKLLKVWEEISPRLKVVIVWDSRGMNHYYAQHPFLLRFEDCLREGSKGKHVALEEVVPSSAEQIAMMLTTSGTTAKPKLALLSHRNLIFLARSFGQVVPMDESDDILSLAPMAWIGEQLYNVVRFLDCGFRYNFPEEAETLRRDLVNLQPTYFGGTPSRWEDIASSIQAAIDNADFLKRNAYRWAINLCQRAVEKELAGEDIGSWNRYLRNLARFLVIRPLTKQVGLGRAKIAITGGAAISPEVFKYFKALDLDMRQIYGQTECTAIATCHREGDVRPESAGVALPGVTLKISEAGEIFVGGEGIMAGYYKNPEATSQAITPDGLLRTGDAGYLDKDGHLFVFDRYKDVMHLAGGTRFAPQDIETRLKFSPYIKEAVVIGDQRPYISALVSIDLENVGNWVKKRGVAYTTFHDLSQKPEVYQLVQSEIGRLIAAFPDPMKVKRFANLIKELLPDDEELTRTRKVRRALVYERYDSLIRSIYGGEKEHILDVRIRFEDGHEATFNGRVKIADVE